MKQVPFTITMTAYAEAQWLSLPAREQRMLEAAVHTKLRHHPDIETGAIKKLRPDPLAGYELRVGNLRVLYNVKERDVELLIVGRKAGNTLIVKGEAFYGHQDNSAEPS
jgi:mRNA-degrading endonuclease RelE of RelBE toxin-antitoxin system